MSYGAVEAASLTSPSSSLATDAGMLDAAYVDSSTRDDKDSAMERKRARMDDTVANMSEV